MTAASVTGRGVWSLVLRVPAGGARGRVSGLRISVQVLREPPQDRRRTREGRGLSTSDGSRSIQ